MSATPSIPATPATPTTSATAAAPPTAVNASIPALPVIPVMRPALGTAEAEAAAAAVSSGWIAQGPRVVAFEEALARRVGAAEGVAVSSCTTGLHLALVLLGIGPGDEVIVPSLSFIATANSVRYTGATPVFADINEATLNLTVETVSAVMTPRTRAVMVVHQAGVPADLDALHSLCDPLGIGVIEDAACAIGATYRDRPIGGGDLTVFSFHPRKVITTGEGGMLMTSRAEWAGRARRLREHGMNVSAAARHASSTVVIEAYGETGFNYRMTDIQAAIGLVQLSRLDEIVSRRRLLAQRYTEMLRGVPGLTTITDPAWGRTNYQSFWVMPPADLHIGRDAILQSMAEQGVQARRGIMACHLESAYAGVDAAPLPITERMTRRTLILPLYHSMTENDQERVVATFLASAGLPSC